MVQLIEDIVPPAISSKLPDNDKLIATLYIRGVTLNEIEGKFVEYSAHADARDDEIFGNDEEGQHGAQAR